MKHPIVIALVLFLSLLTVRSAEAQGFGRPNIYLIPYGCNELDVVVSDSNTKDQGLSNVELLFDPLGVFGHKIESFNVDFDGPQVNAQDGDLVTRFRIKVVDPLDTAYAAIWAINHTGRETLVEWHFKPAGLQRSPNVLSLDTVVMGGTACATLRLLSNSDSSFVIDSIEGAHLTYFSLTSNSHTPMTLTKGNAFSVNVCFMAQDTAQVRDTIWIDLHGPVCYHRIPVPLAGHALTPILYAGDLEFIGVDTGTTACNSVRVWNIGTAPLTVNPNPASSPFQFESTPPATIAPNGHHDFTLCFLPHQYGPIQTDLTWQTNMDAPHTAGFGKQFSHITAFAQPAGLHWDTTAGFYDPANSGSNTIQFYVFNTSKAPLILDRIQFVGIDSTDFFIVGNTHAGDTIPTHDSVEVTIQFTPSLLILTTNRSAAALIVSKGVAGDSLFLNGKTGQFDAVKPSAHTSLTISLYPNPATGLVLRMSSPDEIPRRVTLLNVLGASLWTSAELKENELEVPIRSLPNGEYFLRIAYSDRTVMRKLSVSR
jgi:hypothetical protein